jgi:uridine kinase
VIELVARRVLALGESRLRVAFDGHTAAGKSTFGDEVAAVIAREGRPAFRATLDDFKRPWREASRYDRTSGAGYYHNAYDNDAIRRLLLDPAAPDADGRVALCSIDPLTQIDHSSALLDIPSNGVLLVDGVFALRPVLNEVWDLRVWLHIGTSVALRRCMERDAASETLVRDRYLASEALYLDDVHPDALADVVVDNTDIAAPVVRRE